jgi:hypothetical protein
MERACVIAFYLHPKGVPATTSISLLLILSCLEGYFQELNEDKAAVKLVLQSHHRSHFHINGECVSE